MDDSLYSLKNDLPIRVLHVVGKIGSGGIEKFLFSNNNQLDHNMVVFDYLVWNSNGENLYVKDDINDEYRINDLKIKISRNPIIRLIRKITAFGYYVGKCDYRIIHLHGSRPIIYIYAFLASKAGIENVIVHSHSTGYVPPCFSDRILPIIKTVFKNYPTLFIACSPQAGDFMFPRDLDNSKRVIIRNGIIFSEYEFSVKKRNSIRDKLKIGDKFVVGHVGRFSREKNHLYLIEVFYELQKRINNAFLILIGEGELEEEVRQKIIKLGIDNRVLFYGITQDVPTLLMGMDIMCFPSLWEGMGIVAVEAQAASLPIIVSDAVPDEVGFSRYFHKIKEFDIEKWTNECVRLHNDVSLADRTDHPYSKLYDISYTSKELTRLYETMADNSHY